jgi:hypothetical protein
LAVAKDLQKRLRKQGIEINSEASDEDQNVMKSKDKEKKEL